MIELSIIISLAVLFYFLGKSADLVILNIRKIGEGLGIKIFFLGLILGFFTSLPEFAIGVNALVNEVAEISLGNLLGGIIVLFGLILGASLILNRKIATSGETLKFLPLLFFFFLPLLFGLDQQIDLMEGAILILLYFILLFHQYLEHVNKIIGNDTPRDTILKKLFYAAIGLALIVVISNLIIRFTLILLSELDISHFVIGLVIFALGTNLPEIVVTLRSWQRRVTELSISNLIGSAMANTFIIGIFAFIKPFEIETDLSYYLLILFTAALLAALAVFHKTGRLFSRTEGFFMVSIYFLFLLTQIIMFYYSR